MLMTYLHDEFVKDKQKVGLLAHKGPQNVLIIVVIQLLVRSLR